MALLLFEVMSALEALPRTSMPASHRLVLLTLANYAGESGRAWPAIPTVATITGLGVSTVRRCIGELEVAGWLTRTARSNGKGQTTNVYDVRAAGAAVQAAIQAPARSERGPRPERVGGAPGASGAPARSGWEGRPERVGPPPGAGDDLLRDPPMEPPSEPRPPNPPEGGCAPADAARGDGSEVGAAGASAVATEPPASEAPDLGDAPVSDRPAEACAPPLATAPKPAVAPGLFPGFDSVAPALPPAKAARRAARRPRPAPDGGPPAKKAEVRYAEAYARGQCSVSGEPFAPPTDSHAEYIFRSALKVYALGTDGQPLRAEPLDAWIEASSAEYRRATGSQPQYQGGFHPRKWVEWLGAGKPTSCAGNRRAPRFQGGQLDDVELEAQQRRRVIEQGLHIEQDGI